MKIATLNIKGFRNSTKRAAFLVWLLYYSPDILCLQEIHCVSQRELDSWFTNSAYSAYGSFYSTSSAGVAILIKRSFSCSVDKIQSFCEGRLLKLDLCVDNKPFVITTVYAPNHNPERNKFLQKLKDILDPFVDNFVLGDFNTVFDQVIDRRSNGCLPASYDSSDLLKSIFEDLRLLDIWRYLHPTQRRFTYTSADFLTASRIDLIGIPLRFSPFFISSDICSCPHSDHRMVFLDVGIPDQSERGPSYWKLNVSVLSDEEYCNEFSSFWHCWQRQKHKYRSPLLWWDLGKRYIKELTIKYCAAKRKQTRSTRAFLTKRVQYFQGRLDNGDVGAGPFIHSLKGQLAMLDREEARSRSIRARAQWIEEGESSTTFFFGLEKHRRLNKLIDVTLNHNNILVSSIGDLLSAWQRFYTDLFTSQSTDDILQDSFIDSLESSLSSEKQTSCEGQLTIDECLSALQGMASNKSPGFDGLPKEFYIYFWSILGQDLVNILNYAHQAGLLSTSQRSGIITVSYKKGPRYLMKNWRPISLLNTDYKIASRAIACRLRNVMSDIVCSDQTCSVPGRFIGENVRLLSDSVYYANECNSTLALVSFDQEKAFDRVEWPYLLLVLRKMGFGPSFCKWIHLFYTGPQSSVMINGFFTPFFKLSRGVRQGCPLSAPLYVLIAESLACKLRSSPVLHGLALPYSQEYALISQYIDDTTVLCTTDEEIKEVFSIYDDYEGASGAKLNIEKCNGLWCGSWRGRYDAPVPIQWSSKSISCLGTVIGQGDLSHDNWDKRLTSIASVFDVWRKRSLSLSGKVLVICGLALSRLWYSASVLPMPDWVLHDIKSKVYPFFWTGKKDLVARNVLMQPLLKGGFNLVDVSLKVRALHIIWIRRYLVSPSKWVSFFRHFIQSNLGDDLDTVLASPAYYPSHLLPPFYASVLESWALIRGHFCSRKHELVVPRSSTGLSSPLRALTSKEVYTDLVDQLSDPPRCISRHFPLHGSLYWSDTWQQISSFPLDRKVRDHTWKIAHGVLYTADRLHKFGYNFNLNCFCNNGQETPDHLFFHCSFITSLLLWAQSLFLRVTPLSPSLQVRHLLFGYNSSEREIVPPVFFYLLSLIKYFVWLARNEFVFEGIQPQLDSVRNFAISRLNAHLWSYSNRFSSSTRRRVFARSWNVLGKFSPDINLITWK